MDVTDR
jgi:prenylcysteine oxidase / farnesylcysteine lyase